MTQRVFSCGRVVLDDFSPAFVIARNVRFAEQKKFQILFPDPTKCYFGFWKKHLQRFGKRIWNYYVAHDRSTVCFMYFQILRVRISKSKFYYGNPLRVEISNCTEPTCERFPIRKQSPCSHCVHSTSYHVLGRNPTCTGTKSYVYWRFYMYWEEILHVLGQVRRFWCFFLSFLSFSFNRATSLISFNRATFNMYQFL